MIFVMQCKGFLLYLFFAFFFNIDILSLLKCMFCQTILSLDKYSMSLPQFVHLVSILNFGARHICGLESAMALSLI